MRSHLPGEQIGGSGIDVRSATIAELQDALTAGTLSSADLTACYLDRMGSTRGCMP